MDLKCALTVTGLFPLRARVAFLGCTVLGWAILPAWGQGFKRPDGSVPVPVDWSSRHVVHPAGFTAEQAARMWNDPRVYASWLLHGNAPLLGKAAVPSGPSVPVPIAPGDFHKRSSAANQSATATMKTDWAINLGTAGGVAQGMYPAKYNYDTTQAASCTNDFAVFPVNASTGSTRATVTGTFSSSFTATAGQVTITITPLGGSATTLTLSAVTGTPANSTQFQTTGTGTTSAANLAAAINKNLSATPLAQVVGVNSTSSRTVAVYALTAGSFVTLSVGTGTGAPGGFSWGTVTAGTNGAQANIVGLNQLYSGSATAGAAQCSGLTYPEFIFSYAAGTGPVATSPTISVDGTKIAFVENDTNIGAILHVLTRGSGSTEYGNCTNSGTAAPTCATNPVIPGTTPQYSLSSLSRSSGGTVTVTTSSANTFSTGDSVTIAGVTGSGGNSNCGTTQINTTATITVTGSTTFTYSSSTGSLTCTVTNATATDAASTGSDYMLPLGLIAHATVETDTYSSPFIYYDQDIAYVGDDNSLLFKVTGVFKGTPAHAGGNFPVTVDGTANLTSPVGDFDGTGNIFVGDDSGKLSEYTSSGTAAATAISLYTSGGSGIRDAPIIDTTNAVGYAAVTCSGASGDSRIVQFSFSGGNTLSALATANLNTEGCSGTHTMYDPAPDNDYYNGINSGHIIACATTSSSGTNLYQFGFSSKTMSTTPTVTNEFSTTSGMICSPLTEFNSPSPAFALSSLTRTTNVVTATTSSANNFAVGNSVTIANVAAGTGSCATLPSGINGTFTIASVTSSTAFTFTLNGTNFTNQCTLTGATVTGPATDFLFVGTNSDTNAYSFSLPLALGLSSLSRTGTTVTVTASEAHQFSDGATVTIAGVATNGVSCASITGINGSFAITSIPSATSFTYTSGTNASTSGCNLTSATATVAAPFATYTSAVGGTSGIIVDNQGTVSSGTVLQTESIYFGTLSTTSSGSPCSSNTYCAVKVTQTQLQ